MSMPYPWTDLKQVMNKTVPEAIRNELRQVLTHIVKMELDPRQPMPVLLGFPFMMTRPHPEMERGVITVVMGTLRYPAAIEMQMPINLRPDCILDVHHARVKGKTHAIMAASDGQFRDDMAEEGHSRLALPPNAIGWAFQRAADTAGTVCRHWRMKNGSRAWRRILEETRAAEAQLGMLPGTSAQLVAELEQFTPRAAVELADLLGEYGFGPQAEEEQE